MKDIQKELPKGSSRLNELKQMSETTPDFQTELNRLIGQLESFKDSLTETFLSAESSVSLFEEFNERQTNFGKFLDDSELELKNISTTDDKYPLLKVS